VLEKTFFFFFNSLGKQVLLPW